MQTLPAIALLGATGKAGKFILHSLLTKGYKVNALIRNPDKFTLRHKQLNIVQGDAANTTAIKELLNGSQAVISALGQRQAEPLVAALAAKNIKEVMHACNITRYIFLSGLNIDVPSDAKSEATQAKSAWMRQNFPEAVADKQQAYEIIADSDQDWTMVRLPMLQETAERQGIKVNLYDSPGENISAADLADFVVEQIDDGSYHHKAPFVSN